MDDIRLASYEELQTEIQTREAADTTLSQRIEEVSGITGNGIENLEELEATLDARVVEAEDAIESLNTDSLTRKIVQNLPSDSVRFTFNDGVSRFTNSYRTSCYITEDDGGCYQSVINSGNSNTYRRAYLTCAELMNNATKILVEFDTKFGDRWQIGLADLDQRPGESTGAKYTSPGVAFYIGTSDGSKLYVNGSNTNASITDIWMHVIAVIDFKTKTTEYIITNMETDVVMNSGTVEFCDRELTGITGIEVYTWSTGELCIDNIEITSNYEAQDNIIYMLPTGDGRYLSYLYIDYKPVLIGDSTPTQPLGLYNEEPQRIATWIDGTPVWRVAFISRPIPYLSEEPTLYTDKSYSPFYDYEQRCSKYVKSANDVLLLNGMMQMNVSGDTVLCKRWNELEFEADIGRLNGFINHATMYFTGYAEFVTPKENIKEG